MLCHDVCHDATRRRLFCVRFSLYCNYVEYTLIFLKVVEFRSLHYIIYHSHHNIKWKFLIVTVKTLDFREEYAPTLSLCQHLISLCPFTKGPVKVFRRAISKVCHSPPVTPLWHNYSPLHSDFPLFV